MNYIFKCPYLLIILLLSPVTLSTLGIDDNQLEDNNPNRVKIVLNLQNFINDVSITTSILEMEKLEKFNYIDFEFLDNDPEYATTMPIAVEGGLQEDIVAIYNPIDMGKFSRSNTIIKLDELINSGGYNWDEEFGLYSKNTKVDGHIVMVPHQVTKWALFYNKDIFDNAGINYPDPDVPMTWEEYSLLAKKIVENSGSDEIFGALHMNWPMFWYGEAIMALNGGESFYIDGLSNIKDPIFRKTLKRTYDMQHQDLSIPKYSEIEISKSIPQVFMNGKYGMFIQGSWLLSWAADERRFPRDWKLGIAPMPVDSGTKRKTWGVVNGFGISKSSKHPEIALEVAIELSRLAAKNTEGSPEANLTISQNNLFVNMANKLRYDGITKEILIENFSNNSVEFYNEKVTGPHFVVYESIIIEEVEKYFIKDQDLETTIDNIKIRADLVLKESLE